MNWKQEVLIETLLTCAPILVSCVIGGSVWLLRRWQAWRRLWRDAEAEAMDAEWKEAEA